MFRSAEYYAAISAEDKAATMGIATMAFIGGTEDVVMKYYHYDYYDGFSEYRDYGLASSWGDFRCWRPVVDGVFIYDRVEYYEGDPILVPNIPMSLPTYDDKVVILANCAVGDADRAGYITITNPATGISTTVPSSNFGEVELYVTYTGDNNVYDDPSYTGPFLNQTLRVGTPGPSHDDWYHLSVSPEPFAFSGVTPEFFNLTLMGDVYIGCASEIGNITYGEGSNMDADHVTLGRSISTIALYDTSKIIPCGRKRVLAVEPSLYLFDLSSIHWPDDSEALDEPESQTTWGWGGQYSYAINLNGDIAVYGLYEASMRLPPGTSIFFHDESEYVYGRINKAGFTNMSKNRGGLFYDNDLPIYFNYAAENLWPCSKICIFQGNSMNREPLLQGGIFSEYSANLQGHFNDNRIWTEALYVPGTSLSFTDHSCNHLSQVTATGGMSFTGSSKMNIEPYTKLEFYNDSEIDLSYVKNGLGEPAYAEFTASFDGDWSNPNNWKNRYGGSLTSLPTLRTVVRIKASVTENNAPDISEASPYPIGARCRSMKIDSGFTVDIPVMIFKGENITSDYPQNAGFEHII